MKINILASDPGARNYGISLVELDLSDRKTPRFRVLYYGMLQNTVNDLRHPTLLEQKKAFIAEVKDLVRKFLPEQKVHLVIAERFMTRGLLGTLIEYVSFMLGVLHSEFKGSSFRAIQASTWKNDFRRKTGHQLNSKGELYKTVKMDLGMKPHELDAILIGIYGAHVVMRKKNYMFLNLKELFRELPVGGNRPSTKKVSGRKVPVQRKRRVPVRRA